MQIKLASSCSRDHSVGHRENRKSSELGHRGAHSAGARGAGVTRAVSIQGPSPPHLSHPSYSIFLVLLSSLRSARPCSVFWRNHELDKRQNFIWKWRWLGGKINSLIRRAGNDHISCSFCSRCCNAQAEGRGEAAKGVTGTEINKG